MIVIIHRCLEKTAICLQPALPPQQPQMPPQYQGRFHSTQDWPHAWQATCSPCQFPPRTQNQAGDCCGGSLAIGLNGLIDWMSSGQRVFSLLWLLLRVTEGSERCISCFLPHFEILAIIMAFHEYSLCHHGPSHRYINLGLLQEDQARP